MVPLVGHQEDAVDAGREAPVHVGELELVLEVGEGAQAAHDHGGALLPAEVDQEAPERGVLEPVGVVGGELGDRVEYASFGGLLVDFCKDRGARVIIRGLRALADFEYEFQFAHMNRRLAPGIDSVFFMTDERNHYVSSSLVKEVASLGGDVNGLVPAPVVAALKAKYKK